MLLDAVLHSGEAADNVDDTDEETLSVLDDSINGAALWRTALEGRDLRDLLIERRGAVSIGEGDDVYVSYDITIGGAPLG